MEGLKLKEYLDQRRVNKTALAKALGMSKQNLYQLFGSKTLEGETKKKIERALKVKWADIDAVNIDLPTVQPLIDTEPDHLTKLADAAYLGQKNIERMIAMLEEKERALSELRTNLNQVLQNQYLTTAADREYQAYVIETFWNIQGKTVKGNQVVKELNQKAVDKFSQMQTHGIHLD